MAKIGLKNFKYSKLTESALGVATYAGAKSPGKAISCSVEVSTNDATLYADDVSQENDTTFQKGKVKIGVDRDDLETYAELLGHTYSEEDGLKANANDIAPYIGLGRIVTKMVDNKYVYTVEFLYKVKFAEPSSEENTKGESTEFGTYELEGTVATLKNGDWKQSKDFASKDEAVSFLDTLLASAA